MKLISHLTSASQSESTLDILSADRNFVKQIIKHDSSNMLTKRLRERAPSALLSTVTPLSKHVLRFHKLSEGKAGSRSGKCNAYFTGNEQDVVYGVVFDIDR